MKGTLVGTMDCINNLFFILIFNMITILFFISTI